MSTAQIFDEYFEAVFKQSNTFTPQEYEEHARNFARIYRDILPGDTTCRILDLGCGTGHFLYFLQQRGYANASGIDISPQQVAFCRQHVGLINVTQADAFAYAREKKAVFDLITMHDILEHVSRGSVIGLLEAVRESLRPEGAIVIRTPNMGNPFSLRLRYTDFTHEAGYAEISLYQVLWLAGFRRIEIRPTPLSGGLSGLVARSIHAVLRKLMWYQGYVAPKIMTPLLIAIART